MLTYQLDNAKKLLESGMGEIDRLENIVQTLENNKELSASDNEYLQKLSEQYIKEKLSNVTSDENDSASNESVNNNTVSHNMSDSFCGKCGFMIKDENFCPKCGAPQEKQSESFCGKCGNKIYNNNPCSKCNTQYTQGNNPNSNYVRQRPLEWKSESITLILTIVLGILGLGGIGHIYLGKIARGIGIMIVGFIILIIGVGLAMVNPFAIIISVIILIPFGIWVIFDARDECRFYNDYLEQNGRSPW